MLLKETGVGLAELLKNLRVTNSPLTFEKGKFRKMHTVCCALGTHFIPSDDLGCSNKTQPQKFRLC